MTNVEFDRVDLLRRAEARRQIEKTSKLLWKVDHKFHQFRNWQQILAHGLVDVGSREV